MFNRLMQYNYSEYPLTEVGGYFYIYFLLRMCGEDGILSNIPLKVVCASCKAESLIVSMGIFSHYFIAISTGKVDITPVCNGVNKVRINLRHKIAKVWVLYNSF